MIRGPVRLTNHARARCAEMGVCTKRAKRLFTPGGDDFDYDRPGPATHTPHRLRAGSGLMVAYVEVDGVFVIRTVMWLSDEPFTRS